MDLLHSVSGLWIAQDTLSQMTADYTRLAHATHGSSSFSSWESGLNWDHAVREGHATVAVYAGATWLGRGLASAMAMQNPLSKPNGLKLATRATEMTTQVDRMGVSCYRRECHLRQLDPAFDDRSWSLAATDCPPEADLAVVVLRLGGVLPDLGSSRTLIYASHCTARGKSLLAHTYILRAKRRVRSRIRCL